MTKALMIVCAAVLTYLSAASVSAQAPQPIPSKSGIAAETFVGWQKVTSGLPKGIKYLHRPNGTVHKDSAVWFYDHPSNDLRAALVASAKAQGIVNLKILASHPMKRVTLIDKGGNGASMIADGTRNGQPFRIAAMALYGRTSTRQPRSTGVHTFAAPRAKYASMGGWVVPASLWFKLDPAKDVGDSNSQGNAAPALQARRLSGVGDIWVQWFVETYIQMMQSNLTAMENARKTIVCSGDPSCEIVTGY